MSASEFESQPGPGTNRTAAVTDCKTCGGDRFVTVRLRSPQQTMWMKERGIKPATDSFHEEMAGCPDCNPVEVTYYVAGRKFVSMDPAMTRQALNQ